MRKLPVALALSVSVHVAAVAAVAWYEPDARAPAPADPPAAVIEVTTAELTVALLDEAPADAATAPAAIEPDLAPPASPPAARGRRAIATGRAAASETAATGAGAGTGEPGATEPGRSRWFDLRGGRDPLGRGRAPIAVSGRLFDGDYTPDVSDADPSVPSTGRLAPAGGGTHRSNEGPFVARVARDGGVTLKDRRNFNARLTLPTPRRLGKMVSDWYHTPNRPVGTLPPDNFVPPPVLKHDDAVPPTEQRANDPPTGGTIPVLGGGFDIGDALMRRRGIDPYAARKLAYLDATRDERAQIGIRHREQQLARTAETVRQNLAWMWSRVPDPAARKQALFELWDEAVEAGSPRAVEAGLAARQLIVEFIRARIPAGSAGAYTAEELAAFNKNKRSAATFSPY